MGEINLPDEVLEAYSNVGVFKYISPITQGLINKTYLVANEKQKAVLQEMSPIFDEGIHQDSLNICARLEQCSILAPKIIENKFGKPVFKVGKKIFRLLKYLDGESFNVIKKPAMAFEAGQVLGKFHASLKDFSYEYASKRRSKGDYAFHAENLNRALGEHKEHSFYFKVKPLAEKWLDELNAIKEDLKTTPRHAHGDPKISNILFKDGLGLCLVDFDTLGKTGWSLELADALRSWANPQKEDVLDAKVDLAIAEQAIFGYAQIMKGHWLKEEKLEAVGHAQAVSLCLAVRYLADVLNENYFAFDNQNFSRAAEHNILRACAMHNLFKSFQSQKNILSEMVNDLL